MHRTTGQVSGDRPHVKRAWGSPLTAQDNFWSYRFNATSLRVYGSRRDNHGIYGSG